MVDVVVGSGSPVDVVEIYVVEVEVEVGGEAVAPLSTLKTVHALAKTAKRITPTGNTGCTQGDFGRSRCCRGVLCLRCSAH